MPDFWAEAVGTVVSTVVGGLITLGAGWFGARWSRRSAEVAAMNAVVVDLSTRRALTHTEDAELSEAEVAAEDSDYNLARRSVLEVRTLIKGTLAPLKPASVRSKALLFGFQSCNEYLELSRVNPSTYGAHLNTLSTRLGDMVSHLHGTSRRILLIAPGSEAYLKVLYSSAGAERR